MKKFQLENKYVLIEFLNYGGILTKMINKKTGQNYLLAYENDEDYQENPYFFGAMIGRNAGRTFPPYYLNYAEEKVVLDTNEGNVHLHGGENGLHQVIWQLEELDDESYRLWYEDVDSPYEPITIELIYRLIKNRFTIEMRASSPIPTIINLTNHSYFNLTDKKTIGGHFLQTAPARIQLIDEQFVPTGEYSMMQDTETTPFNFTQEQSIKKAMCLGTSLSKTCAEGIDLAYCFMETESARPKIILTDSERKNSLKIYSDQESCIIYTLNKISDQIKLSQGNTIEKFGGVTFEMQRRPNYVHSEKNYLTTDYKAYTTYEIE